MLQGLLANELAAVIQYGTHRALAANLGFKKYVEYIDERISDETEHAKKLRGRLAEFGVVPASDVGNVDTAEGLDEQLQSDDKAEETAIKDYENGIKESCMAKDEGTADVLREILADEIDHKRDIDANLSQINLMSLENWISIQV
jgi:bacterioferritin